MTQSIWQLRTRRLSFERGPAIMGILNVTPDSFSDGGRNFDSTAAVDTALRLEDDGADIIDIGGESTRPYSDAVGVDDERRRVLPVIDQLRNRLTCAISIDTSKAILAREAIQAGVEIINDVSGLEGDPEMLEVARTTSVGVCAMHMQGNPQTMQDNPSYDDVTEDVFGYLQQRLQACLDYGISRDRICLDPGIGFGKTHQHNLTLLRNVDRFLDLDAPILIGHSRKGFIGKLVGDDLSARDAGTLGISIAMASRGIHVLRVHNVGMTTAALRLFQEVNFR